MAYPAKPPRTEEKVQIKAYTQAFVFLAIIMGMRRISGGIGKKELSAKEIILKIQAEYLCSALFRVQV